MDYLDKPVIGVTAAIETNSSAHQEHLFLKYPSSESFVLNSVRSIDF